MHQHFLQNDIKSTPCIINYKNYTFFNKKPSKRLSPQSFLKKWILEPSKFLNGFLSRLFPWSRMNKTYCNSKNNDIVIQRQFKSQNIMLKFNVIFCSITTFLITLLYDERNRTIRGWTLLMGNTRPECFLMGLKFSEKKIRGLKFLGENLRGLKSISNFNQFFFKISIFWKIQIQTFEGVIYCSKTPASTSPKNGRQV